MNKDLTKLKEYIISFNDKIDIDEFSDVVRIVSENESLMNYSFRDIQTAMNEIKDEEKSEIKPIVEDIEKNCLGECYISMVDNSIFLLTNFEFESPYLIVYGSLFQIRPGSFPYVDKNIGYTIGIGDMKSAEDFRKLLSVSKGYVKVRNGFFQDCNDKVESFINGLKDDILKELYEAENKKNDKDKL